MRVQFIGPEDAGGLPPKIGALGTYISKGNRVIRKVNETPEEREAVDLRYSEENSLIHWDGIVHPWNCPNSQFVEVK